jgi:hypothetical protein
MPPFFENRLDFTQKTFASIFHFDASQGEKEKQNRSLAALNEDVGFIF